MADDSMILDCLDGFQARLLTIEASVKRLEERPVGDLDPLRSRLDDVGDMVVAIRRALQQPPLRSHGAWKILLAFVVGIGLCWLTVRYWPSTLLPPGFMVGQTVSKPLTKSEKR